MLLILIGSTIYSLRYKCRICLFQREVAIKFTDLITIVTILLAISLISLGSYLFFLTKKDSYKIVLGDEELYF